MNIVEIIRNQLYKTDFVVKISDKTRALRLSKEGAKKYKFVFSYDDIIQEFQSIEGLLAVLKTRGFLDITFTFQKLYMYADSTTYNTVKEVEYNSINGMPNEKIQTRHSSFTSPFNGMGFNQDPNVMLGAMLNSERLADYKKMVREQEEDIRDLRSENRQLREQNNALLLKNETSEARADLKIQKELLEKKGILENEGVQKLLDMVVSVAPGLIKPASGATPLSTGMSGGLDLSPIHEKLINLFEDSKDLTKKIAVELMNRDDSLLNKYIIKTISQYNAKKSNTQVEKEDLQTNTEE